MPCSLLDPQLSTSYPSAILARERAIVVNLEFVKAIIAMGGCRKKERVRHGRGVGGRSLPWVGARPLFRHACCVHGWGRVGRLVTTAGVCKGHLG